MNKQELIRIMEQRTSLNQKQCAEALECMMQTIAEQVAVGEKIQLVGFGSFERKYRKSKTALNPKTQEPVEVSAAFVPQFKPGKAFKEMVNQ